MISNLLNLPHLTPSSVDLLLSRFPKRVWRHYRSIKNKYTVPSSRVEGEAIVVVYSGLNFRLRFAFDEYDSVDETGNESSVVVVVVVVVR